MMTTRESFSRIFGVALADLKHTPAVFDAAAMLERLISKRDPIRAAEIAATIMQTLEHDEHVPQVT